MLIVKKQLLEIGLIEGSNGVVNSRLIDLDSGTYISKSINIKELNANKHKDADEIRTGDKLLIEQILIVNDGEVTPMGGAIMRKIMPMGGAIVSAKEGDI